MLGNKEESLLILLYDSTFKPSWLEISSRVFPFFNKAKIFSYEALEETYNLCKKNITQFSDKISLKTYLENKFNLPVVIDNDSRTIGIAEQVLGAAKGVNNAIIIKVSRSLGLSIINESLIIKGSDGLAGNFSHTQFQ